MIKKIVCFALALSLISFPAFGAWDKSKPAGTDLISDIDSLVIANNTALESAITGLRHWYNLKVVRTSATVVTVTADRLAVQISTSIPLVATSVSEAIDITESGAGGLDTGAEGDVWYYIWIIEKTDGTVAGLLSASATAPTMPAGYTYKTLVSAVHNTSGDFVPFTQEGNEYWYTTWISLASGNVGAATWSALDLTPVVPSALSTIVRGTLHGETATSSTVSNENASDPSGSGYYSDLPNHVFGSATFQTQQYEMNVLTANTIYWAAVGAANQIYCSGFKINKLS